MADKTQQRKIKCPHCGWIRTLDIDAVVDESTATVTRGVGDELKKAIAMIKAALADSQLDEANAWIDMPKCPHCGKVYRYNARTGGVKP